MLRSHYQHLRALLAVAIIAVVGLAVAVKVLAASNSCTANTALPASSTLPANSQARATLGHRGLTALRSAAIRYDGGPEEGTRGPGN